MSKFRSFFVCMATISVGIGTYHLTKNYLASAFFAVATFCVLLVLKHKD